MGMLKILCCLSVVGGVAASTAWQQNHVSVSIIPPLPSQLKRRANLGWKQEPVGSGSSSPGTESPEEKLERAVAILKDGVPVCGGVAVGDDGRFIATAAHCLHGVPKRSLSVQWGADGNKVETVKRVIVHPYYLPPSSDYDIALLRRNPTGNERLKDLELVKVPPAAGDKVQALSWNWKENGSEAEMAEGTVEGRESCGAKLSSHIAVSSRMLCADIRSEFVVEGSPLIVSNGLVGIGSFYVAGDKEKLPKVFTNIANSEIRSFIESYVD